MIAFIRSHSKLSALLFTLLNWFVWVGFYPSLQNDDFQIAFLLQGGGEGASKFSLFPNIASAWILAPLQETFPDISWHLLTLFLITIANTYCINFLFFENVEEKVSESAFSILKFTSSLFILFYIDRSILTNIQFTYVGLTACCVGALLIARSLFKKTSITSAILSFILITSGFCTRNQSITAFIFIMAGVWGAYYTSRSNDQVRSPRIAICTLVVLAAALTCLHFLDSIAYSQSRDWETARAYSTARYNIQDYPDNSNIDKSHLIESQGITGTEYRAIRSFLYVPSLDSLSKIQILSEIHKQGKIGLFGSDFAAEHNILTPTKKQFIQPFSSLMIITPWGTLSLACFLFIISVNRRSIRCNGPVLLAFCAYMACLLILGRSPSRVVTPMVITTAFWVLTHLPNHAPLMERRWIAYGSWVICALGVAFCFRHSFHWRPSSPKAAAHEYCAAHPENLYITTNQQGCGLFPVGLMGYSMNYLHKTNVLPVGDGWMFYTPAYRAALAARKIDNPYCEILKDNVYVITFRKEDKWALKQVADLHELYTGNGVEFSKVTTIGEHSFWKAHQRPSDAK